MFHAMVNEQERRGRGQAAGHALATGLLAAGLLATAGLLASAGTAPARAEGPALLSFGVGAFDIDESDNWAAQFEIQYRPSWQLWLIRPMVGFSVTHKGSVYGYGGFGLEIELGSFMLRPSVAAGLYGEGDGKDLGHVIEFRSGVELSYKFENQSRLGLEFYHRSNADIGDINPGEESLMLTYALPLGSLFGR